MNTTPNTAAAEEAIEENGPIDTAANVEAEFAALKERANLMGVKYSPNIGLDSLRARVNEALLSGEKSVEAEEPEEVEEEAAPVASGKKLSKSEETAALRERLTKDAMRLVRLRITNLNPNKAGVPGEIVTVANRYIGAVKKYIPFGEVTDEGYHIPNVLYQNIKDRVFLDIKVRKDPRTGKEIVIQRWVKEFALEVLPQLTKEELEDLAKVQAASGSISA